MTFFDENWINKVQQNIKYGFFIKKDKHVVINFVYDHGHDGGYTDDLGIIADKNTYIEATPAGYYSPIPMHQAKDIAIWCRDNLKGDWNIRHDLRSIYIANEEDVAWFTLRWS